MRRTKQNSNDRKHSDVKQNHKNCTSERDNKIRKVKLKNASIETSKFNCECGFEDTFPVYTPWIIYLCILVFRLAYVSNKQNWWILHHEEIFNCIEVAFSEVFGYGFRTYEYLPPPINATTAVEEQEFANGMFSLRSFLFPRFYITLFQLANLIGVQYNPYLLARQIHVCVTSFLPVSVFYFTRSIYACPSVSSVAAILVAFSLHITELGTHTLVNSFISPFFFFAITPFVSHLVSTNYLYICKLKNSTNESESKISHQNGNLGTTATKSGNGNRPPNLSKANLESYNGHLNGSPNQNSNEDAKVSHAEGKVKSRLVKANHDIYTCAISNFIGGIVIGILIYIRFDLILIVGSLYVTLMGVFSRWLVKSKIVLCVICTSFGAILGILLGGFEDCYRYKSCFLSPLQWYRFNILTNISSVLFGTPNSNLYVKQILALDTMTIVLNILTAIGILIVVFRTSKSVKDSTEKKATISLMLVGIIQFGSYTVVGHKEIRFLHNFMAMNMVISSYALHSLVCFITAYKGQEKSKFFAGAAILLYVFNWYNNFPPMEPIKEVKSSNHKRAGGSSNINECIDFIGQRNDVTGVFIDQSIYITGGFSILRKDVPIIVLIHNEYHVYSKGNRTDKPNLRIVNRFSDFIAVSNVEYLGKILTQSQEYNYIVTSLVRKNAFNDIGFKVIHSTEYFVVLYRKLPKKEAKHLKRLGKKMKLGQNSTVLEYESSWLFTAGVYDKAIERSEAALSVDDSRIRTFQILGMSYVKLNDRPKALEVEQRCFKRHGKARCSKIQPRTVLHKEYSKFDLH